MRFLCPKFGGKIADLLLLWADLGKAAIYCISLPKEWLIFGQRCNG